MKRIAIIGAGVGGMTAAYDLIKAGHSVVVYDGAATVGGLAGGFKDKDWDWSLEKFYHHWFLTDKAIFDLIDELGWKDRVIVPKPKTVVYFKRKILSTGFAHCSSYLPRIHDLGHGTLWICNSVFKYLSNWKSLEKFTSHEWMKRHMEKNYATHFALRHWQIRKIL